MFPIYEPQLNNIKDEENKTAPGKSFLFDFKIGDFILRDGKLIEIEGIEALKVWIEKILKTEKFKFKIYETGEIDEYGITLLELINSGHQQIYIQAEIQRTVTETLEKNVEIINVDEFSFSRDKRTLVVNFTVNSVYGSVGQEVRF
ncbi:DUF2634 domain-containing protein [Clostridium sulfidigenes]|uniref:DUF2634 domain-containing protein n=1 Tax=Clostridium sulfidigenes TaxID=318464 RepID=UPI0006922C0E|nr:DUF2634 domain-containing protein [Clostridium sulfidigenes]